MLLLFDVCFFTLARSIGCAGDLAPELGRLSKLEELLVNSNAFSGEWSKRGCPSASEMGGMGWDGTSTRSCSLFFVIENTLSCQQDPYTLVLLLLCVG